MSGGAFDYFYYKIDDDLGRHTQTLSEMIQTMEENPARYGQEAIQILKEFGARLTAMHEEAKILSELIHDVEWVASNDYGPDAITEEIRNLKQNTAWWNNRFNPQNPQGLG